MRKIRYVIIIIILSFSGLKASYAQKNRSIEEQFQLFKDLGFQLNNGTVKTDLELSGSDDFLVYPYSHMYTVLARRVDRKPWIPLTNCCWEFQFGNMDEQGDYVKIIQNLERITQGKLAFKNVKDNFDEDKDTCWVSFNYNGIDYKFDLKIEGRYADFELFTKIVELTQKSNITSRYTIFETNDESVVFGFETPDNLKQIKKKTGLKINWLK